MFKQNLGHVWLLGPHALGKLTFCDIYSFLLSIKQKLSCTWLLGSYTWGKINTITSICFSLSVKTDSGLYPTSRIAGFEQVKVLNYLSKCWEE